MKVSQAVPLTQVYAPQSTATTTAPKEGAGLGGHKVTAEQDGVGRAYRSKGTWDRFTSRTSHGFKQFKDVFASKDQTADNQAVRFNARHEKFSGKVENLVARLVSGDRADVESGDVMATLRNDVKLMHRDAPWADRQDILATRMDVELSKLSDKDLTAVSEQLRQADTAGLTGKDKTDLETMKRAVVRQQVSRSPEMGELLGALNHGAPGDVSNKATVLTKMDNTMQAISGLLTTAGVPQRHDGRNEDILGGAIRMRLGKGDSTQVPGMNRNLLNLESAVRKDAVAQNKSDYITRANPGLRVLARAVREEYLKDKVGDFQDSQLRTRMKVLGAGAAHEVSKGVYEKTNGSKETRVHKYDDEEIGRPGSRFCAPARLGIDPTEPRLLERAVFTAKLDEQLGFNVSVGTDFAKHHDQLGIVMELAGGVTASSVYTANGNPGAAQRDMTKLQLLDCLTGQADRHRGNYMVQQDKGGQITGVKAIDSDFCMGPEPDDPEKMVGDEGVHLTHLPPVIDTDMAKAIRDLRPEDMTALCGDMFDDKTVQSALGRLDALKKHVDKLEGDGRIIAPTEWGTDETTKIMKESFVTVKRDGTDVQEKTSYWQRDYPKMEYNPYNGLMFDD